MREEIAAFSIAFIASAVMVSIPYMLLSFKGIPIGNKVPAQRIALELGAINTAFMISRTLASWWGGKPKAGSALMALGTLGVLVSWNFPTLALSRALQGLGSGLIWPSIEMGAAKRGAKGLVQLNASSNLGFSLGSIFAGAVLGWPKEPVMLVLPLTAIPFFVKKNEVKGKLSKKGRKVMRLLYAVAFLNGLALGMRGPIFSAYVLQYVSASPLIFSAVGGVPGLVTLTISLLVAGRIDLMSASKKLHLSSVLKAFQSLVLIIIAFVRDPLTLIILLTLGRLSAMLSVSASKAAQAQLSSGTKEFGRRQSMFGLGNAIGPIIGGALYKYTEALGIPGSYDLIVVALMGLASSFLLWRASSASR